MDLDINTVFNLCKINSQFRNYCRRSSIFLNKAFNILKEKFVWIENERQRELNNLAHMENLDIYHGQQYSVAYQIARGVREVYEHHFDDLERFFEKTNYSFDDLVVARSQILQILRYIESVY
tara:strand:- start:137 stop:502 length:366 start_codon:yes stop_codon:yes gene_type:complete